jgi:hypothetical protein
MCFPSWLRQLLEGIGDSTYVRMVPGEGSGPNVFPFGSNGWRRPDGRCDGGSFYCRPTPNLQIPAGRRHSVRYRRI